MGRRLELGVNTYRVLVHPTSTRGIDRRLNGLAGPEYDATISFGLPIEPEDSQYGESWFIHRLPPSAPTSR